METVTKETMGQMMDLQMALMNEYVKIGALPEFPLPDLNSKENQSTLKKFKECFVEELGEAFEQVQLAYTAVVENHPPKAIEAVGKYNQEVADAWHFLLEFLILAGYGEYQIGMLLKKHLDDIPGMSSMADENRPIFTMLKVGNFINYQEGQRGVRYGGVDKFTLVSDMDATKDPKFMGCRRLGPELYNQHRELLWDITYEFNLCCNALKNRAWAQSYRDVNLIAFETKLAATLLAFGVYLDFAGFTETSIVLSYKGQNDKNIQRIKNGY